MSWEVPIPMSRDDFEVVAYKILVYLYACLKAGAEPSVAKAQEVAKACSPHTRG